METSFFHSPNVSARKKISAVVGKSLSARQMSPISGTDYSGRYRITVEYCFWIARPFMKHSFSVSGLQTVCSIHVANDPIQMDQCLMHPYIASKVERYPSVARMTSFVQLLGQLRARAKRSCIQFKTRQGNFWFAHNVVYKIPYRRALRLAFRPSASREQRYLAYNAQGSGVNSSFILLCLYIFIVYIRNCYRNFCLL